MSKLTDACIPVGRMSLAKKGMISLQVQTEYASRPYPRVTTTVHNSGQMVHKIERKLEHAVSSTDEQTRIEAAIQQQHSEVMALIEEKTPEENSDATGCESPADVPQYVYERLAAVPGLLHIYRLGSDGFFIDKSTSTEFRKAFTSIFKNIQHIVEVFPFVPGEDGVRRKGVCEIERHSLYFVSAGSECYFVAVNPTGKKFDYEATFKQVLADCD